jgi:hypothetical protein
MCGVAPTAVLQCCECAAVAQAGYCRTTVVKADPRSYTTRLQHMCYRAQPGAALRGPCVGDVTSSTQHSKRGTGEWDWTWARQHPRESNQEKLTLFCSRTAYIHAIPMLFHRL